MPSTSQQAISISRLTKTFVDDHDRPKIALNAVSLEVPLGQIVGLFGPSGCGKTTLLRIICGVLPYDSGDVLLFGRSISEQEARIAYVPQNGQLLAWKTLWDNALLGWSIVERNSLQGKQAVRERASALFARFGMKGHEGKFPSQCSGGEQQKTALIRALLTPTRLLVLDEPAGAIDHITRAHIYETLLAVMEEKVTGNANMTALIVSHDPEDLLLLCDDIIVMTNRNGTTVETVRVPFARPRGKEMRFEPPFIDQKKKLWEHLL